MNAKQGTHEMNDPENTAETELLLLALLERWQADRALGLASDLSIYCSANPELEEIFLEMALATNMEEGLAQAAAHPSESSVLAPLSPGVRRALERIPGFAAETGQVSEAPLKERKIAESPAQYNSDTNVE